MFNSTTIGSGLSESASSLLAWGLGRPWEAWTNVITDIPRVVHAPVQVWKVVQSTFAPRVVHGASVPKVVNTAFIPRFVQGEAVSKAVLVRASAGKVVRDSRIPRVQVTSSQPGKVVRVVERIPKIQHGSPAAKVVVQTGEGKVVR